MKSMRHIRQRCLKTQWFFQNVVWAFCICICSSMASDLDEQIPKEKPVVQGHIDGTIEINGDFQQVFNNDMSSHCHIHLGKSRDEEDSELDTVITVVSESDIKISEGGFEEEIQKRLRDALKKKKKPNKVYQGESYDFGSTSTSSGVTVSSGISFKKLW